jgi:hypothetical protein
MQLILRIERPWIPPVRLNRTKYFVRFQVVRLKHGVMRNCLEDSSLEEWRKEISWETKPKMEGW